MHGDLAQREAAVARRHQAVPQHREAGVGERAAAAGASRVLTNTPPESVTSSVPVRRARARRVSAPGPTTAPVEAGRHAGGLGARPQVGDDRRQDAAPQSIEPVRVGCAEGVAAGAGGRGSGRAPSSSIAACASYPARWQTPASEDDGVEQPAHAGRGDAVPGRGPAACSSRPQLVGAAGPDARQVADPRRSRPRAGGPAPSGTDCAPRRRRRAAATYARCAKRSKPA